MINRASVLFQRFSSLSRLMLGASSGVLVALAYPMVRWNLLAWIALAPLYLAWRDTEERKQRLPGFLPGFAFGFALFLVGASWMTAVGTIPWVILAGLMGILFGVFGVVIGAILPRLPESAPLWVRPLVFAALWTLTEWVRSLGGYAFPWFVLAATQAGNLPILQIVSLTGQWGLTFALALTGAFLGEAWAARGSRALPLRWLAGIAAVWVSLYVVGSGLLAMERSRKAGQTLRVGVVQGSFPYSAAVSDFDTENLRTYINLTIGAAQEGRTPDLILWPEGVTSDQLLSDRFTRPYVTELARRLGTALMIGTTYTDNRGNRYNSAVLLDRNGDPRGRYDKRHVVPVGEFFPFRPILQAIYLKYNVPDTDFAPGREPNALTLSGHTFGVMICYDVAFPWEGREAVQRGATFLTQITSDDPFEETNRPDQHAALTALRCVETRRWMVRSAFSGVSQVVDATGQEVARIPVKARQAIVRDIELRDDRTLYVLGGDWFVGLCGLVATGGAFLAWRNSRPVASATSAPTASNAAQP